MPSITRETIIDRRQPAIRWSAVFAGTTIAVGLWGVLQLLGVAAGLAAIDPDDPASAQGGALGIGALSLLAPLIATFVGGYVAAKLASTHDQKVAGAHGLVVWGLTAVIGLGTTLWLGTTLAMGAAHATADVGPGRLGMDMRMEHRMDRGPHRMLPGMMNPASAAAIADARDALAPINQRLRGAAKPELSPAQLIAAAQAARTADGFDADRFVEALDEGSALSKEDAAQVATQLGPRTEALLQRMGVVRPAEHDALKAMERTGQALLSLGAAILLAIGSALLGSLLAVHAFGRGGTGARREGEVHTTAPYPATTIVGPGTPTV